MKKLILSLAALISLYSLPLFASQPELPVDLVVSEPSGVDRSHANVSGGIPLPWGVHKADQAFAVYDGEKRIPAHANRLVVDENGYLRWILVDLQTDIKADETKTFTLKTAEESLQPENPLKVKKDKNGVAIDTGKASFFISKEKPFSLFTRAEAGGSQVITGGSVQYADVTTKDEKMYRAAPPKSIELEYSNPLRATVCVRGDFVHGDKPDLAYITRITAWAGRSDVFVRHVIANSNPEHYTYRRVKNPQIRLDLAGKVSQTIIGGTEPRIFDGPAWIHQGLAARSYWQPTPKHTKIGHGEEVEWTEDGKKGLTEGWINVKTENGRVYASDLHFSENPSRQLRADAGALVLNAGPKRFPGRPDKKWPKKGNRVGRPYSDDYRWIFDCSHFEAYYNIDLNASSDPARNLEENSRDKNPLHLRAPANWYAETEGLPCGKFGSQEDEMQAYENWDWEYSRKKAPQRPEEHGGIYVKREANHYETEADITQAMLLMYLRTGSRSFFNAARGWATYNVHGQPWRTDGWKWKDGGVWWGTGGPIGNRPQRTKDPVTGLFNGIPHPYFSKEKVVDRMGLSEIIFHARGDLKNKEKAKRCYCHNWGIGIAGWYLITGRKEALEAVIDDVEQDMDTNVRYRNRKPGKQFHIKRGGVRSIYVAQAGRLIAPQNEYVKGASEHLARMYLERPRMDPRGLPNPPPEVKKQDRVNVEKIRKRFKKFTGEQGLKAMDEKGIKIDPETGALLDPDTGHKWHPITNPNHFHYPWLSPGLELYYRLTGNENALDFVIAYGRAVGQVMWQDHGQQKYKAFLVDFPVRGVAKDKASWILPSDADNGEGISISGYLARWNTDPVARGYYWTGLDILRERSYQFWNHGSHRRYRRKKTEASLGKKVSKWANYRGPHSESATKTARLFYVHGRPRKDSSAPAPITDLRVQKKGDKAAIAFTAPEEQNGGRVLRYQVKCAAKPIQGYEAFLESYNNWEDDKVVNWWMAANLEGEPDPAKPGSKETFVVTGVPEDATHFAVRSFDKALNRSKISNIATVNSN